MSTAVELLRKGGTLVSESCSTCNGVQVKFSGKVICVSCGKEEVIEVTETDKKEAKTGEVVTDLKNIVLSKISELLPALKAEKDLNKQADVAKLIKHYLEVLEKIPKDNES
jgi:uncharacterized Zn finger protein (UPF0148 family)